MKYWQLFSVSSLGSYAKVNKLIFLVQYFFACMLAYSSVCHFLHNNVCSTESVRLRNDFLLLKMFFFVALTQCDKHILVKYAKKIPHTGDTNSLDRCGY